MDKSERLGEIESIFAESILTREQKTFVANVRTLLHLSNRIYINLHQQHDEKKPYSS